MPAAPNTQGQTLWMTKKVKSLSDRILLPQRGFPIRVSDSSVGGGAGQFCALCDVIAAAEGRRQQ